MRPPTKRVAILAGVLSVVLILASCILVDTVVDELDAVTGGRGTLGSSVDAYQQARIDLQALNVDTMSEEDEYFLGRSVAASILDQYDSHSGEAAHRYINTLGQSLALASTRPLIYAGYRFQILDTDEINGLSTPGGHVFVTTGLLNLAETEDELAAILAHEISHVAYRHGAQAVHTAKKPTIFVKAVVDVTNTLTANEFGEALSFFDDRVAEVTTVLVSAGYSQETEFEADEGAIQILLTLGYDPFALVRVLERLREAESGNTGERRGFLTTHPNPQRRIRRIRSRLQNYPGVTRVNEVVAQRRYAEALGGI